MKPADNIKRQIKNLRTQASAELDKKLHLKFQKALEEKQTQSAYHQPNILRFITSSRIAIAAAVTIIAAAWFVFTYQKPKEQIEPLQTMQIYKSESLSELTSTMSLNAAFQRGGIKAVEEQLAKADKKISRGLKEQLTIKQLLCELGQDDKI
ncbi:MAG: hypothetical protein WCZ89_02745 [Phycisphaerae bacterium]